MPAAGGGHHFVMLEDVVRLHLDQVFQGYSIRNCHALRVTRDSDLPVEEDPNEDLMKMVEEHLRSRRRGAVVRLQYEQGLSPALLEMLIEELELAPEDLYPTEGFAAFSDLMQLYSQVDLPHLKDAAAAAPAGAPAGRPRQHLRPDRPQRHPAHAPLPELRRQRGAVRARGGRRSRGCWPSR